MASLSQIETIAVDVDRAFFVTAVSETQTLHPHDNPLIFI